MVSPIPKVVLKTWEQWNIRGVILLSLSLQTFLILFAPLRKRTYRSFLVWFIWLAYLLADWAASFCIGLISNQEDEVSVTPTERNLMAFWAPFLLLHLGGPDTITAFALEDNELWHRHLLALIFHAVTAAYAILLTLPANSLSIPTALIFLAGLIKYVERTRALFSASMNTFRHSMVKPLDAGPDYVKLLELQYSSMEAGIPAQTVVVPNPKRDLKPKTHDIVTGLQSSSDPVSLVKHAYHFVEIYKGLIVDEIVSFEKRNKHRQLFLHKTAEEALILIEVELNFIYELFFTKVSVVRNKVGCLFRFVSFGSIVISLGLFINSDEKYDFNKFDGRVTYTLLYGAVALDTIGLLHLIFSDRTAVALDTIFHLHLMRKCFERFLGLRRPRWSKCKKEPYTKYKELSTPFIFRRWSGVISGYSLMTYCVHQYSSKNPIKYAFDNVVDYFGARELEYWTYKVNNPFLQELWEFIMNELKRKSKYAEDEETTQWICSARGEWVLQASDLGAEYLDKLMPFVDTNAVNFYESLIMWHVATHLCHADTNDRYKIDDGREFSKLLSDYMLYLLVMQSSMMSPVAGIGQIRFQDTCAEAKSFISKRVVGRREAKQMIESMEEMEKEACKKLLGVPTAVKLIEVKGDRSKSLLFDACRLAKELNKLEGKKWEIISKVWVEMLSFAACNCRPTDYVKQLSKGGELISIVWLLMVHLGLGRQFQIIRHGDPTLIVDK